ncbi:MAG: AAA family ATPase [bacterium]|nr:AAA family ATPase [bacterium]
MWFIWLKILKYKQTLKEKEGWTFIALVLATVAYIFSGINLALLVLFLFGVALITYTEITYANSVAPPVDTVIAEKTKFTDVGGCDEAVEQLKDAVDFLKDPGKYSSLGGRMPKGLLLVGPPGTGKTLLAKAVAGEADVPFFENKGTDFVEMYVGVGAGRIRTLFKNARAKAPCVVFIDEIDAVGRKRAGSTTSSGHQEYENAMLQLCTEIDGFETSKGILLIAATNRPDSLDPALVRPGRFDKRVLVDRPDVNGRKKILTIHIGEGKLNPELDAEKILLDVAKSTPGLVGADLGNIINEAAVAASKEGLKFIEEKHITKSLNDTLMGGVEIKGKVLSFEEKKATAYHEAGHAVVGWSLPVLGRVNKVSIIRRGMTGGGTMVLPDFDRQIFKKSFVSAQLQYVYGGRAGEKLFTGEFSSGSGDDIRRAKMLAKKAVCHWGMGKKSGSVYYGRNDDDMFLDSGNCEFEFCSEEQRIMLDMDIRNILEEAEGKANNIVEEYKDKLESLVGRLLILETLEQKEIYEILGEPIIT